MIKGPPPLSFFSFLFLNLKATGGQMGSYSLFHSQVGRSECACEARGCQEILQSNAY